MSRLHLVASLLCVLSIVCPQGMTQEREKEKEKEKEKVRVVKGRIKTFTKGDPAYVVITSDTGEVRTELAPMTFIEREKLVFNANDEVTIRGFDQVRDGQRTFVASEVTVGTRPLVRFRKDDYSPIWTTTEITKVDGEVDAKQQKIMTITGKVKTFTRADPSMVIVTTGSGDVDAELAPITFLEEQKLAFNPNDEVTIKGYKVTRGDHEVFVVTEVTTKEHAAIRLRRENLTPVWVKGEMGIRTTRELRDLTGTVTIVDATDSSDGRLVTIKTDAGERVIALAPGTYLEKQKWELKPSDSISIKGYELERDGRKVFVTTELRKGDQTWKFRREDGTPLWE